MSTETTKVRAKVAALNASLDKLETELAPLLDKPLAETLAGLEPIEKARLQTLLPYIIYDLSFSEWKSYSLVEAGVLMLDSSAQSKWRRP